MKIVAVIASMALSLTALGVGGMRAARPSNGGEDEVSAHTPLEISYISEVNRLRGNPKGYIVSIQTYLSNNGAKGEREIAERELIPMLDTMKPLELLKESASLRRDLDQHKGVNKAKQTVGHDLAFSWRKTPLTYLSENIGSRSTNNSPQTIVIQLLIDLGVPKRGHRDNLLDPTVTHTAVRRVDFESLKTGQGRFQAASHGQTVWWIQAFARF